MPESKKKRTHCAEFLPFFIVLDVISCDFMVISTSCCHYLTVLPFTVKLSLTVP